MSADILTLKTPGEVADAAAYPPAAIDSIQIYSDFFKFPAQYQRIHVHMVGVTPKDPKDDAAGLFAVGLFGKRSLFRRVNPSVAVETFGDNTGSTDYFPIGKHKFMPHFTDATPVWDAKSFVIGKKGNENTAGIKLVICDGEKLIFECELPATDFPAIGEDWKEIVYTPEDSVSVQSVKFVYRVKITECKDKISSKSDLANFLVSTKSLSYSEKVIDGTVKTENALVQCWKHNKPSSKAVLWLLGRNDCFMHPHVGKTLFTDKGYDLYVLNYSAVGMCRKRGWVEDALFNSHNSHGDFDLYLDQIEGTLNHMKTQNYSKVLGYAHSTGGPILINYLMKRGDADFDGFMFNSPFLDWGADAVGSELQEFVIEHIDIATSMNLLENDSKVGKKDTPDALKETPLKYLNEEILLSDWSAKLWSQFYFDFRCRPLYSLPMTPGFAKGVNKVHKELLKKKKDKKFVTLKPIMCITSRADDTLTAAETLLRIDIVGPARYEIELHYNSHDVFLSEDEDDVRMAVEMARVWMDSKGFE